MNLHVRLDKTHANHMCEIDRNRWQVMLDQNKGLVLGFFKIRKYVYHLV